MNLPGIRETEVGEPSKSKKVCAVCQSPADKSCGAYHRVDYCSVEHQKSHKDCPPIRISTSPELGRHFVATRDLPPPGTLIHTQLPVLASPIVLLKDIYSSSCISCRTILHPAVEMTSSF